MPPARCKRRRHAPRMGWGLSEPNGQSRRERNVVAGLRIAIAGNRLEPRDVVPTLEPQAKAPEADLTTECPVAGHVGFRVDVVEVPVVVRPPTDAETHERREVPRPRVVPRWCARFG